MEELTIFPRLGLVLWVCRPFHSFSPNRACRISLKFRSFLTSLLSGIPNAAAPQAPGRTWTSLRNRIACHHGGAGVGGKHFTPYKTLQIVSLLQDPGTFRVHHLESWWLWCFSLGVVVCCIPAEEKHISLLFEQPLPARWMASPPVNLRQLLPLDRKQMEVPSQIRSSCTTPKTLRTCGQVGGGWTGQVARVLKDDALVSYNITLRCLASYLLKQLGYVLC